MSALTQRALRRVENSGFARAKKLADLAIKTNVDSSGSPTAAGYEQAMSILQPYLGSSKETEAIDAQRLLAGYGNSLKKITSRQRDQNETVAAFKLQENDAYFSSFDGDDVSFRNPIHLAEETARGLDEILYGVINAIEEKEANGDSTDALYSYMNDLQRRADTMRDLTNRLQSGELSEGQMLDGFGYYVDTDPIDGSIRSAAFLPAGLVPEEVTKGFRRLDASTKLGNSLLPVYAPAQRDSMGDYVARVGDATWTGSGDGALRSNKAGAVSKALFEEGNFNISDRNTFPTRKNTIGRGQFATALIGRDADGNPVDGMFYRGIDDKLYAIDEQTIQSFKTDPVLAAKLEGYVPRFSPTEAKEFVREAQSFTQDRLAGESRFANLQNLTSEAEAEVERVNSMSWFDGLKRQPVAPAQPAAQPSSLDGIPQSRANEVSRPSSFFADRVNRQNKPDQKMTGQSPAEIVEAGKNFFRKTIGGANQ